MSIFIVDSFLGSSVHNLKMFPVLFLVILLAQTSVTHKPASESADIVLLIDSSDAVGRRAFSSVKSFVNRIISSLPIGPNKYRVALVQYSDDVHIEVQLDDFKARNPMLNHIKKSFAFRGGSLRTGNAIQTVHETFFKTPRKDRNQILVVSTSGRSEDAVEDAAKVLQDEGVKVIALGTLDASLQELEAMATHPFYYYFDTPRDLLKFSANMPDVIRNAIEVDISIFISTTSPPSTVISMTAPPSVVSHGAAWPLAVAACHDYLVVDVVFVLDESIPSRNAKDMKAFLKDTINLLDVRDRCTRIGLVTYSTEPKILSSLNTETEKLDILKRIQDFSPKEGKAHLGAALNFTRKKLFTAAEGSRMSQGVEQLATIITHRPSNDDIIEAATLLRRSGVTVFTIGIEGANTTQLTQIASYPPERYVTTHVTFPDLPSQSQVFQKKLFNRIQDILHVQRGREVLLETGCESTEKADIYFLIDGSSSISWDDFIDMKTFLQEVVQLFTVGPDHVRFGVVQYSNNYRTEFELHEYTKSSNLEKAINNIKQLTGDTYTGAAIRSMQPLFEKARKQRDSKVPCYLIVLTDGEAHDGVLEPARKLRNEDVIIYAIGVKEANKTQLYEIAGSMSRVYFGHAFDSLKDIKKDFGQNICYEKACKEMKADIMFLVDSSGSIGPDNFEKMKDFMKMLVNKTDVGPDRVQIGVAQFSDINKGEFPLNKYYAKTDINAAIERMSLIGETTLTGGALKFVSDYFEPAKGARPSVNKILILITDGEAQDEVRAPAAALRKIGIIIYSVGIFNANKTQLEEISGKYEQVFYVENFDILKQIEGNIIFDICDPQEVCKRIERLDVVFVIDSSGSIGDTDYDLMKDFMIGIVNKSEVDNDYVRFGAVKYSDDPHTLFYLNTYSKKSAVIDAIQRDIHLRGSTYTAEALQHSEALFTEMRGSRKSKDVPQVLMIITDGDSNDKEHLHEISQKLRDNGIIIYAIGIKGAKSDELLTMAGSKEYVFYVDEFDGLQNISKTLSDELCNISKPECDIEADIVFLMDGSKTIPDEEFKMMKKFFKELVDRIGYKSEVQFGMAQFSKSYQEEFCLGKYQDKLELMDKISNVSKMSEKKTYIGSALRQVQDMFTSRNRSTRSARYANQKLLLITDGKSDDDVVDPAEILRGKGVEIYAIGVGEVDEMQLQQITGSPDKRYELDDFSELSNITKQLAKKWCKREVKTKCFVDVVMGFDISSQSSRDYLFNSQRRLVANLPDILKHLTSFSTVSCGKETKAQFSVAIAMENTDQPVSSRLQVDFKKILEELRNVKIGASHLNVEFLDRIWNRVIQHHDQNRNQVLLLFSDGLDDDIEALEKKSEELRQRGLDGLITVALEGATNFDKLHHIEFGKGFGYNYPLTIGIQNIAKRLHEYMVTIAERKCCCVLCRCAGMEGPTGPRGKKGPLGHAGIDGSPGHPGEDGEPGARGTVGPEGEQGVMGCQGNHGQKGLRGLTGETGENGIDTVDGIDGEEGARGLPGLKGENGDPGQLGSPGPRGLPGDDGQKGFQGDPGNPGADNYVRGSPGLKGTRGRKGERGPEGSPGFVGSQGNKGADGQRGRPGPAGSKGTPGPDGRVGDRGFLGPQGAEGAKGVKGEKGIAGSVGLQGNFGEKGSTGNLGKPGTTGNKGEPGNPGTPGATGHAGRRGLRGEEGTPATGRSGKRGPKGQEGCPGDFGMQGDLGDIGNPGEPGPKGHKGRMGPPGQVGGKGDPGARGNPGRPGLKGARGPSVFSPCELIEYVRELSPCWTGTRECPVYPTELVFALDVSQDTTPQLFERMREIVIGIVNDIKFRESNCPVGARVAVVSYNSDTHYLIRFSDFHRKSRLLQELRALSYQRSTSRRDIGGSMRFVARNAFKRTLQGANVRKVAVFFSNGPSDNPSSIDTAVLEFSALDIHPVVVAFKNIPEVNRAFAMDDTRLFQVISIHQERDYSTALQRLQSCVLCYDKCNPDESCFRLDPSPREAYMDAAFILDSSRKISPVEFQKMKDFLSTALDNFDIAADPQTSLKGDRVAVVSHTPLEFRPQTRRSPVKTEFDFVTFSNKRRMKRHIQASVQQLNGSAAVGHAIQWTVNNIFSVTPNQRKYKAIFIISAGETSQWDKEVLGDASLRAKCRGYAVFVLSLGAEYDAVELGQLASVPLEQHLVQLGRTHKAKLGYAANFLKPFVRLLKGEINSYPPAELREKCAQIEQEKPLKAQLQGLGFDIGGPMSSGDYPLNAESVFLESQPIH
ncbi:collagen alpha-6(VI) chain-like [Elgaria multicarinata webbii]|uniref:collagen alpha-6(VI) chain-like n=1 Tax=Elgaria multicarinata webbii TaxID=159646 RepID=UPI002FCD3EEB